MERASTTRQMLITNSSFVDATRRSWKNIWPIPGERIDNQAARHKQSMERQITETRAVLKHLASSLDRE